MEPHKEELKKTPAPRTEERKRRFQIEQLEERIAPSRIGDDCHLNPHNHPVGCGKQHWHF